MAFNAVGNHIVLFCPVFASHIPSKVSGFFDRLFDQADSSNHYNRRKTLEGRSARIISVLDDLLFEHWHQDKSNAFMSINKEEFKHMHLNPVHTATIGHLKVLGNSYSKKWVAKLQSYGKKEI